MPTPRAGLDGGHIHTWTDGRLAVVLSWVGGRHLDKSLRPLHLERMGRLTGAMHRVAEKLVAKGRITGTRLGDGPELDLWAAGRSHPALTATAQRDIQRAAERLQSEMASFSRGPSHWGFIHSDLHRCNLLFEGRAAGAIDFSECGFGHHAQDLAATLHYLKHPLFGFHDHAPLYPRHRDALLEGYAQERALPPDIEHQIDRYIEWRTINTIEWILFCWTSLDELPWGRDFLERTGEFFST